MTFLIYETHPDLADALLIATLKYKLPPSVTQQLQFHGLLTQSDELTNIANMILKEDTCAKPR